MPSPTACTVRSSAALDVVTDGEMGKVSFLTYVKDRLGGFTEDDGDMILPASWRKEIADFPGFYNEYLKKYKGGVAPLKQLVCTGPVATSVRTS